MRIKTSNIWTHGKDCSCKHCEDTSNDKNYIIYDNGKDFCDLVLPQEGFSILLKDQNDVSYILSRY